MADPQKFYDAVELARHQLAQKKTEVERAKGRARLAKRRRKEAKQSFRRARKELKRAKLDVGEAEQLLANAEAKLVQLVKQPAAKRVTSKKTVRVSVSDTKPRRVIKQRTAILLPTKQMAFPPNGGSGPADPLAQPALGSGTQSTPASLTKELPT